MAGTAERCGGRCPEDTRQQILEAALEEFRSAGFQGASVNHILARTALTKGALYHHFPSKLALGYAVMDEMLERAVARIEGVLERHDDVIEALQALMRAQVLERPEEELLMGCPGQALIHEMAALDEGFHERFQKVFGGPMEVVAQAVERGQRLGQVRPDVDPRGVAALFSTTRNGLMSMARMSRDPAVVHRAAQTFLVLLEGLRPCPKARQGAQEEA